MNKLEQKQLQTLQTLQTDANSFTANFFPKLSMFERFTSDAWIRRSMIEAEKLRIRANRTLSQILQPKNQNKNLNAAAKLPDDFDLLDLEKKNEIIKSLDAEGQAALKQYRKDKDKIVQLEQQIAKAEAEVKANSKAESKSTSSNMNQVTEQILPGPYSAIQNGPAVANMKTVEPKSKTD